MTIDKEALLEKTKAKYRKKTKAKMELVPKVYEWFDEKGAEGPSVEIHLSPLFRMYRRI